MMAARSYAEATVLKKLLGHQDRGRGQVVLYTQPT
jgi:hypothetical protein